MSRRKAFNTGFSQPSSTTPSSSSPSPSDPTPALSAPAIDPPDPAHATLHVPTADQGAPKFKGKGKNKQLASASEAETPAADVNVSPPEIDDSDTCFICAEPITFWSVGVCGHRTCHVCAIRLRVFYKKFECTYCKTICPSVSFSRTPTAPFPSGPFLPVSSPKAIKYAQEEAEKPENKGKVWYKGLTLPGALDVVMFPFNDEKMNVVFEDEDMMEQTLLLLRYNCPFNDCPHMASNWSQLGKHTLAEHGLVLCRLCTTQLSRFAHEQVLYPPHLIGLHDPSRLQRGQRPPRPRGDDIEMVKGWDAPHPMCEFCHEAFFGVDELFKHMRDKHELCFVCRDQLGEKDVFFQNFAKLDEHFKQDHFACPQPSCVEEKFVVFATELDLRAHLMEKHSEAMSARDRAQARQVNIDFVSRAESSRPGTSRYAHGRGFSLGPSGSDLQHQQIAPPPMNQAQAAQQNRQKQIDRQEDSRRRKAFVTSLSEGNAGAGRVTSGPGSARVPPEPSASGFSTPREDVDDATVSRHGQLLARVSAMVGDSATKLASFRSAVRGYKTNESGASDMIDTIFNVFDQDVDSTVGIVREVANLMDGEDAEKKAALLEGLNGWRVKQQENFPALGGAPTGTGTSWAGISSGRILSAKRATNIGRSSSSRNIWDRVEAAAASHPVNRPPASTGAGGRYVPGAGIPSSAFPSLGAAPSSSVRASGSGGSGSSTPWSASGSSTKLVTVPASAAPPRSIPAPAVAGSGSRGGPNIKSSAAFPSLPSSNARAQATAERQALFNKPTPREESLRRIAGTKPAPTPVNGWTGVGNGVQGLSLDDGAGGEGAEVQGGGGKKKGKGKQLLFTVSARPS